MSEPIIPQPVAKPRVTIVSTVYHQVPGDNGSSSPPARYSCWLESSEDAYDRTVRVGPEWTPLDLGWVGDFASVLSLTNVTKRPPGRIPTETELAEEEARVLLIGLEVAIGDQTVVLDFCELRKGETMMLHPVNLGAYRVRASSGECKCSVFLVPA